eukprot:Blabericola_migrator_1__9462@NODE_512_length_7937_cov_88_036722_g393_i0_p7_GENE_NODE_512_length_7937_cov_88_036722_g393_i0NODE_512_length_7937_cov_88_036722_g393_i0_p7_ORF_typecomplete_len103_score10_67_NODE_512_length_7937_cov_88_036722_g393_i08531161
MSAHEETDRSFPNYNIPFHDVIRSLVNTDKNVLRKIWMVNETDESVIHVVRAPQIGCEICVVIQSLHRFHRVVRDLWNPDETALLTIIFHPQYSSVAPWHHS